MVMSNGLSGVKSELNRIITELHNIESGLRNNFEGIGSEVVAARLREFIEECERAHRSLSRVDTTKLTDAFLERNSK
jgi:hypothetical protein